MTRDYLLEVGSDEIPARYLPGAVTDLGQRAAEAFRAARLRFDGLETYGTPRRLVLYVRWLGEKSEDAVSRVRGPSKRAAYDEAGRPTKALLGFCRSPGHRPFPQVTLEGEKRGASTLRREAGTGRPVASVPRRSSRMVMGIDCPHPCAGETRTALVQAYPWVVSLYDTEVVSPHSCRQAGRQGDLWPPC